MKEEIKHIRPEHLTDIKLLRQIVVLLLNQIEELNSALEELRQKNQELEDEINKLKGEQGKPVFKPNKESKHPKDKDKKPRNKNNKRGGGKKGNIKIDKEVICDVDKDKLPADAVFKGYDEHIQQDIEIKRKNTLYKLAIYYSPSEKRTYRGIVPASGKGMYGTGVKTLLNTLNRVCDTTQSRLKILFDSLGISISTGSINNYLLEPEQWVLGEQKEILRAGLAFGDYAQIDGTKSVERGVKKVTQIICGAYFTVFYTKDDKKRLSILEALQGMVRGESVLKYGYNEKTEEMLEALKVSPGTRHKLKKIFGDKSQQGIFEWEGDKDAFEKQMKAFAPKIMEKKNIYVRVMESFALSYYYMQDEFPVVEYLISDDAPEYRKLAKIIHGLCWIHDARFYKKLIPKIDRHEEILSEIMGQYWDFYDTLLAYKEGSQEYQHHQKELIEQKFDNIFNQKTDYYQVNECLERTLKNKNKLLAVLEHPALPLHNNASELGARRIVRKRDISLHSWSVTGTLVRDAFMSIVETCLKLNISPFDYIKDRITGKNSMPTLSSLICQI
jgi:hypothetical protein